MIENDDLMLTHDKMGIRLIKMIFLKHNGNKSCFAEIFKPYTAYFWTACTATHILDYILIYTLVTHTCLCVCDAGKTDEAIQINKSNQFMNDS